MQRIYQSVAAPMFLTVVLLAAPGTPQQQNYYHGHGSQIVDSHGKAARISGISWWGMETSNFAPLGLDKRPMDDILNQIHTMGFNTVRIPFSNQMLHNNTMPKGINYDKNPELNGLNSLQVMDHVIAGAREHGMRVILDRHRPDSTDQSELWYTPTHSEDEWISDWKMLAARYRNDDTVIGFDLHNEPHGKATWGTGDKATDWRLAAERCGNAVLSVNPNLLILVEGVETVDKEGYWWGGNLSAAGKYPVRLSHPAQLVYSAHDYPPSVGNQKWFAEISYPHNLPEVWSRHWGYLAEENRVPVLLGEFGSHYATPDDKQWMAALVNYVSERNIGAMYWSLNPESEDTGGILRDDWQTVDHVKLEALEPVLQGSNRAGVILASYTPPARPRPTVSNESAARSYAPVEMAALNPAAMPQSVAQDPARTAAEAAKSVSPPALLDATKAAAAPVVEAAEAASAAFSRATNAAMSALSRAENGATPVAEAATKTTSKPTPKLKFAGKQHPGKSAAQPAHSSRMEVSPSERAPRMATMSPEAASLSPLAQAQRMAAESSQPHHAGKVVAANTRRSRHSSSHGTSLDFEPTNPLGGAQLD